MKKILGIFMFVVVITLIGCGNYSITIYGNNEVEVGKTIQLDVEYDGNQEVVWTSSDNDIATVENGLVTGISVGVVTVTVTAGNYTDDIEITVITPKEEIEKLKRVNEILENMTLSQKIGQMFVVGFNGTTMSSSLENAISNYNFGNVIYMAYNVSNPTTLVSMSNSIQNKMVEANGVPGFITTDQEGGRVARLTNGGTHFISQMAVCATNDPNNAYLEGLAIGKELRSYGINVDFAPVLDVNNNPDNPVIGIRSYSDDPNKVASFGNNMFKGLADSNVIGCVKHFPGHGNTSVDSHYGLPIITSTMEELYEIELAPFISAIENGVQAIMTTHIIFEAINSKYPATLSEKVLTGLLRNTLNYDGLIITDGMGMNAITQYFGTPDVTSVQAVKAGVDIILYTSINDPIIGHKALMKAVEDGEISEERINESVRRILMAKLENDILDNYLVNDYDRTEMLKEHEQLNNTLASQSLTQVIGNFYGLDKNKSTIIISPTTTYSLGSELESNSLSCFVSKYLKENGHSNVTYKTVSKNITSSESQSIISSINQYDQIVVAFSNVKTSNYSNTATFVKKLLELHDNVVVIALDTPYDALMYGNNLNNYICLYGYQLASVEAISKYLNGEFKAEGVSPIDNKIFN